MAFLDVPPSDALRACRRTELRGFSLRLDLAREAVLLLLGDYALHAVDSDLNLACIEAVASDGKILATREIPSACVSAEDNWYVFSIVAILSVVAAPERVLVGHSGQTRLPQHRDRVVRAYGQLTDFAPGSVSSKVREDSLMVDRLLEVNERAADTRVDEGLVLLGQAGNQTQHVLRVEVVFGLSRVVHDPWRNPVQDWRVIAAVFQSAIRTITNARQLNRAIAVVRVDAQVEGHGGPVVKRLRLKAEQVPERRDAVSNETCHRM